MTQKILVAESDTILRERLIDKLSGSGYKVFGVENGGKALELMYSEHPNLLILDTELPAENGIDVLANILANKETSNTPVIALSNSDDPEFVNRARKLGVKYFLLKSISDVDDILDKVRQVIPSHTKSTEAKMDTVISFNQPESGKKKILMVEDDRFLREIAAKKLEVEGFVVISATGGTEALEYLGKNGKPDIIILDLILPGMSGFEILEKVKQDENLKNIPVIILSNLGQEEDIEKAKKLGAADYLVKAHFSFAEIVQKIHDVIG